jgi:hypothetical protein
MNYYMSTPFGINPATLGQSMTTARIPASAAVADLNVPAVAADTSLANTPPAGYSYVGCFTETPGRTLSGVNNTSHGNTQQQCSQFCPKDDYFGVESGMECHCGTIIDTGSQQVLTGCTTPCAGDNKQACGGTSLLSIYKKETQTS